MHMTVTELVLCVSLLVLISYVVELGYTYGINITYNVVRQRERVQNHRIFINYLHFLCHMSVVVKHIAIERVC